MHELTDPAALVLNKAVQTYSQNARFMSQMTRMENEYKMRMQGIMMGRTTSVDREDAAQEEEEKLIQYVETAVMGVPEKILEEEINMVGKGRPAKVEEIDTEVRS